MIVASKDAFGIAVGILVAGKLPHNDSFVCEIFFSLGVRKVGAMIPLEAVRIMSGFSCDVAIAVTHPLCPSRDPRNRNWSEAILCRRGQLIARRSTLNRVMSRFQPP